MSQPKLKIFRPEELLEIEGEGNSQPHYSEMILEGVFDPVRIAAGDFFHLIHDAISSKRAWLQDFEDDAMVISRDFYEVLLAYQRMVEKRAA
jgi:hypothetical protein